jgi:hypothetical protein
VKRKTFYHICLALPYLALLVSGMFMFSASLIGLMDGGATDNVWAILLAMLLGSLSFLWIGGIIWVPLYTWMVIVMLFWSRGKSAEEVRNLYLFSPILLGCSMGFPAALIDFPGTLVMLAWGVQHLVNLDSVTSRFFDSETLSLGLSVGIIWAFMAAICVAIGYVFVGIALLLERLMKKRGLFKKEEESLAKAASAPSLNT